MTKIFKYSLILVAFILFTAQAQAIEKERIIKKSYKVDSQTELKIKNSFGKIDIESYDGNEIFIEVKIWAKGNSESKVTKFINSIEIDFDESHDEIEVETSSISNNGKVKKFEVNYTVKVPTNNELSIEQSFGNVYFKNHQGKIDLEISHGNLEAGIIENKDNEIEMQFSNGNIESFSKGSIDLSHSNLDIVYISSLNLESEFGNVTIKKVKGSVKAEISHGSLKINSMNKKFNDVEIKSEFSQVNINLEDLPYNLEYYGSFSTLSKPSNFELKERDKDFTSEEIKGEVNGGGNRVLIKASHSNIDLD